jgi:hypothetical protein
MAAMGQMGLAAAGAGLGAEVEVALKVGHRGLVEVRRFRSGVSSAGRKKKKEGRREIENEEIVFLIFLSSFFPMSMRRGQGNSSRRRGILF